MKPTRNIFGILQTHEDVEHPLLKSNTPVYSTDNDGQTPLHKAVENGQESYVQFLLKHGADINATIKGETLLHKVILEDRQAIKDYQTLQNKVIMCLLLKHGANINEINKDGQTLLHEAVKADNKAVKADNEAVEVDNEAVEADNEAVEVDNKAVVQFLLKHGANVNITDKNDRTLLQEAMSKNHGGARLLPSHSFDINATNAKGCKVVM
jgi:ankyrin repeat protein